MEENKELDDFIRKIVEEVGFEQPSDNFTNTTLSKIELITENNSTVYKPIISRSIWVGIVVVVIGIFIYVIFNKPSIEIGWLSLLNLNKLAAFNTSLRMPDIFVSNIYIYACIVLAFFVGVQVLFLKRHFEKRYMF